MTSTAESARWYDNPRLGASPNTGGSSHQSGGVDASDMGAFYALENAGHRRYYSTGYAPHGKNRIFVCPFYQKIIILKFLCHIPVCL